MKDGKFTISVPLVFLALVACSGASRAPSQREQASMTRQWGEGAVAPGRFAPWQGAEIIILPSPVAEFEKYLLRIGAKYEIRGDVDGARSRHFPTPANVREGDAGAVVFSFGLVGPNNSYPRYIGYIDAAGSVNRIEKAFSYTGP
jgi:hypothetical protein